MNSRFTEIFIAQHPYEICNSEPCSPSLSTLTNGDSFFTCSSDSLNTLSDFNMPAVVPANSSPFIHQTKSFASEILNEDSGSPSKNHLKSKLKLFMATLKSNRRNK